MENNYHPEPYWNDVAKNISRRSLIRVLAGDDEPYYRYKRKKFLNLLHSIDFEDKVVLEVGSGPGGNLEEVLKHRPKELHGVDIAEEMVALSKKNVQDYKVVISKIDGEHIPYGDAYFDIVFTSTVLQHNTDAIMLQKIVHEICRVSAKEVYLFERIEKEIAGTALCLGRPVAYYSGLMERNGFTLAKTRFLNVQVSYLCSGMIRKVFNKRSRREGAPVTKISSLLQRITLPLTSVFDLVFKPKRELAMLHYVRRGSGIQL